MKLFVYLVVSSFGCSVVHKLQGEEYGWVEHWPGDPGLLRGAAVTHSDDPDRGQLW